MRPALQLNSRNRNAPEIECASVCAELGEKQGRAWFFWIFDAWSGDGRGEARLIGRASMVTASPTSRGAGWPG